MSIDPKIIQAKLNKYQSLPPDKRYDTNMAKAFVSSICDGDTDNIKPGLFSEEHNMVLIELIRIVLSICDKTNEIMNTENAYPNYYKNNYAQFDLHFKQIAKDLIPQWEICFNILSAIDVKHFTDTYSELDSHLTIDTINSLPLTPDEILEKIESISIKSIRASSKTINIRHYLDKLDSYIFHYHKLGENDRWKHGITYLQSDDEQTEFLYFQLYDFEYDLFIISLTIIKSLPKLFRMGYELKPIKNEIFKFCYLTWNFFQLLTTIKKKSNSEDDCIEGNYLQNNHLLKATKYLEYLLNKIFYLEQHHTEYVKPINVFSLKDLAKTPALYEDFDLEHFGERMQSFTNDPQFNIPYPLFEMDSDYYLVPRNKSIKSIDIYEASNDANYTKKYNDKNRTQLLCCVNGLLLGYVPDNVPEPKKILKDFVCNREFYLYSDIIPYDFTYAKKLSPDDFCYIFDIDKSTYRDRFYELKHATTQNETISSTTILHMSDAINRRWILSPFFKLSENENDARQKQYLPIKGYEISLQSIDQHFETIQLFMFSFTENLIKLLLQSNSYDGLSAVLKNYTEKGLNCQHQFSEFRAASCEPITNRDIKITIHYLKYVVEKMYSGSKLLRDKGADCILNDSVSNVKKLLVAFYKNPQNWCIIFPNIIYMKMLFVTQIALNPDNNITQKWGTDCTNLTLLSDKENQILQNIYNKQ